MDVLDKFNLPTATSQPPLAVLVQEFVLVTVALLRGIDNGTWKVLFTTVQVLQSVSVNMDTVFPPIYTAFQKNMNFVNFDISGFECQGIDVLAKVVIISLSPLVLMLLVVLVALGRWSFALNGMQRHRIVVQHSWALLLLSYIVLPPVAQAQLQAMNCRKFNHSGDVVLRVDTGIDCTSTVYQSFTAVNAIFIFAYLSLPIAWYAILHRVKADLFPHGVSNPHLLRVLRKKNPELTQYRFLFETYRPNLAYFGALPHYFILPFASFP